MRSTITTNTEHNGIEISFEGKPAASTRDALKKIGFRWHNARRIWYAKNTPERLELARAITDGAEYADNVLSQEQAEKRPAYGKVAVNKYGVRVGDLYRISWGWEQTNVNFFQVVELVGKSSVRIREVYPEIVEEEAVSSMAVDRRYRIPDPGEILPPADRSSFVENQEKGDLHRVQVSKYGGDPYIKVGKPGGYQDTARKYDGGVEYVSWYA